MRSLKVLAISILMLLVPMSMLSIASAHHKGDHDKGTNHDGVTEDNDGDGVGNAPDPYGDSDNKHPSGKDKHAEGGKSGNQGNSQSDPDGDSNGGADKPGGSGGVDQLDQDGNNGCGNDDDFEDDNNGNCGGPAKDKRCEKSLPPQAQGHAYGHERAACEESAGTEKAASIETEEKVLSKTSTDEEDSADVVSADLDDGTRSGPGTARPGTGGFDALDLQAASSDVAGATPGGTSQYRSPSLLPLTGIAILIYLVVAGGLLATGAYFHSRDRSSV